MAETEQERAQREIDVLSMATYDVPETGSASRPVECDVIMKGGITSGVVYPLTICKLATRYRLRNIGGTSAGAIAAAVAAAAEYRRRHDERAPATGFQSLAVLPFDVSQRLESLFQPTRETEGVFRVLLAAIGGDGVRGAVAAVVRQQRLAFCAGLGLVLALAFGAQVLAAGFPIEGVTWVRIGVGLLLVLPLALVVGVAAAVAGFASAALRVLPQHDFGLTDGATYSGSPREPGLTEWLADAVDGVAGLPAGRCLTLGDLWGPEGLAAWTAYVEGRGRTPVGEVRQARAIDLQTMTTDLTLRRPFRLPFGQQDFLFDEEEMRRLFPDRVVATMKGGVAASRHRHPATGEPLFYFPGPGRSSRGDVRPGPESLPLVVMARMSLSFPGLLSAVPLYAVDRNGDQGVVRHLFSDGGISSNFPMHFFDSLLPTRPTFGINLSPPHPVHPDDLTWLPSAATGGVDPRAVPFETVPGFAQALRDTVQNWSDNTQVTQRGYAERVVEIRLRPGEGGLNLAMPPDVIMALVARGAEAGDRLVEQFEWDPHRVIRYRTAMTRLVDALAQVDASWTLGEYESLLADYPATGVAGSSFLGSATWRQGDQAATRALLATIGGWRDANWHALSHDRPAPAPVVRMAPE
ncbi:patatin-like phospholipase family protein [Nocardioides sp. S-58]|uniref:Patatin-like phospholipase family protein n=1 Tax=Nocardioides renjunii TaxID=3095075 RepID=A0ABU5KB70_9ACTN|nr:patatin-like phospholipase family protein [Nocardioides sp. S-58]MDZ5662220.1 patatin-like phospholipase family protein [Nocardioides sp. S-58]